PPRADSDDQPGQPRRRHIGTGGDTAQSVLMRTLRTTLSRFGPRNPGHSAGVTSSIAGAGAGTAGFSAIGGAGVGATGIGAGVEFAGAAVSIAGAAGNGFNSSTPRASNRSSGVGVHLGCITKLPPLTPSVRINATGSQPITSSDATRASHRVLPVRRPVVIAHAANAKQANCAPR